MDFIFLLVPYGSYSDDDVQVDWYQTN